MTVGLLDFEDHEASTGRRRLVMMTVVMMTTLLLLNKTMKRLPDPSHGRVPLISGKQYLGRRRLSYKRSS